MLRAITHYDQIPLSAVIEIMEREIHARAALAAERINDNRSVNFGGATAAQKGEIVKPYSSVDIFRVEPQGVLWLESAGSVDEAKARIQQFATRGSGEYVVLNHSTGNKLTVKIDNICATEGF